jgi:hypothetical protein
MTEKEHDVNYADPEEESKGTFEQKVWIIKSMSSINKLTNFSIYRLISQRLTKSLEKRRMSVSSK